ncbi:hypothetical protein [Spirulina sp. CCNP1310]|uniref:hypothetical protein n=1 Tax=Spirulina sp. CCNP1310 TaxID=3110249 RepID=UPI002B221616|nr:hypothetical protein [Spirulina sp. CCNP1310]
MSMIRRIFIFGLLVVAAIGGVILSHGPAQATSTDTIVYTWAYPNLGSHERVCKAIVTHPVINQRTPKDPTRQRVTVRSHIVDPQFCQ